MIQTVASAELPADEMLRIRKNRILPETGEQGNLKRISIVTGIHGDELEGQYVAYELQRRIAESPSALRGIVDIYPAMNPMGIDTITRGIPDFDLDMNRIFPGHEDGDMYEHLAGEIIEDLKGSDLVIDIHASNIFLTEIPQIRINVVSQRTLLPLASAMNVDLIWIHENSTVLESTLAFSLNSIGVPTLVVEMGVGMRITRDFGNQLTEGILATMKSLGVWDGETQPVRRPVIMRDPEGVEFLNAPAGGVFIKEADAGSNIRKGELIGRLVDPLTGRIEQEIQAPCSGWVFSIREYPVVQEGSLMGRILKIPEYHVQYAKLRRGKGRSDEKN